MGRLHDAARAKAEVELSTWLREYRIRTNDDPCAETMQDSDGSTIPSWIKAAAIYAHKVFSAFCREILGPRTETPDECIESVDEYRSSVPSQKFAHKSERSF